MCEPKETCENCKYSRVGYRFVYMPYGGLADAKILECHLSFPDHNGWPKVRKDTWCGVWENVV